MNGPTRVKCTPVLPFMWDILCTSFYAGSRPVVRVRSTAWNELDLMVVCASTAYAQPRLEVSRLSTGYTTLMIVTVDGDPPKL